MIKRAFIWSACLALMGAVWARAETAASNEFHFIRLIYDSVSSGYGFGGRGRRSWTTDMPEAEDHLMQGVRRLTRIDAAPGSLSLPLTDDTIFDYPFLYAVEVGHWSLSDPEAERLREYLSRGGFLMVDDFHGTDEWQVFLESIRRVFPDRPIVDLAESDPIFHTHFNVDHRTQIPGIVALMNGVTYEKDGVTPYWKAIRDDSGRIMVIINHNMDLGDAWEHADSSFYPVPLTNLAYHFAIDYMIYAMTH